MKINNTEIFVEKLHGKGNLNFVLIHNADGDYNFLPNCSHKKLSAEAPHFEIGKVIGSKCWAKLEVPDQINAMIMRFLQVNKH